MIDFIVTIIVIIALVIFYIVFNHCQKNKTAQEAQKSIYFKEYLQSNVSNIEELSLCGVGDDGNSDYEFSAAIKKINLSDNVMVKLYE